LIYGSVRTGGKEERENKRGSGGREEMEWRSVE